MLPGDEQMLTIAEDMEANGCTLAGGLLFVLVQNLYHQGSSPPDGFHIMAFRLQATRVSTYIGCLSQDDFGRENLFTCLADHINWICCKFVVILPHWIIHSIMDSHRLNATSWPILEATGVATHATTTMPPWDLLLLSC